MTAFRVRFYVVVSGQKQLVASIPVNGSIEEARTTSTRDRSIAGRAADVVEIVDDAGVVERRKRVGEVWEPCD